MVSIQTGKENNNLQLDIAAEQLMALGVSRRCYDDFLLWRDEFARDGVGLVMTD